MNLELAFVRVEVPIYILVCQHTKQRCLKRVLQGVFLLFVFIIDEWNLFYVFLRLRRDTSNRNSPNDFAPSFAICMKKIQLDLWRRERGGVGFAFRRAHKRCM
jgi:hypothetical protein